MRHSELKYENRPERDLKILDVWCNVATGQRTLAATKG